MNPVTKALYHDFKTIAYRPELRAITNSVTATILLQQVFFRWVNNDSKPFYKFKEPCNHKLYKHGDSWCEELGFSRAEFDTAWKALSATGIASKKTNMERLTYYTLNESAFDDAVNAVYSEPSKRDFPAIRKEASRRYVKADSSVCSYTENTPDTTSENKEEDCRVFPPKQVFGDDKQKQSSPKKAPSKKSTSRAYHEDISEQEYPLAKHALEWLDGAMANAIERGETLNIAVSPHTGRPNVSREHLDAIEENLTDLATDAPDGIDGATHVVKRLAVLYNKYLCKLGKKVNFSMFCAASLDLDKRYGQWVEQMIRRGEA